MTQMRSIFGWGWLVVVVVVGLSAQVALAGDSDMDGHDDAADNCPNVANASQLDGDGDGAGNACDADFNNDGKVDAADLELLQAALAGAACAACDLDESGDVNVQDFLQYGRMVKASQ